MLIEFQEFEQDARIEADLCIIGAGAAGITLARQFRGTNTQVVLLESGGADFEAPTQALNAGPNLGMPYYELEDARLRFFGGTTAIWGGRCVPLDDLDFEKRDWVPWSGWPFGRAELEPWYRQAHEQLNLGAFEYDEGLWPVVHGTEPLFNPDELRADFWRFDMQRDRFNLHRCADLVAAPNIRVLLHANCVRLQAAAAGGSIASLQLAALSGRRATLHARRYVLACGGIENPRLLLASNDVQSDGIGNAHDLVGRFFMEHPHGRAGRIITRRPWDLWMLFRRANAPDGIPVALALRPGLAMQRRDGGLNAALTVKLQRKPALGLTFNKRLFRDGTAALNPSRSARQLLYGYKRVRIFASTAIRPVLDRLRAELGLRQPYLIVRGEQAPNPDSRVTLTHERDALGMPRAALDWRLGAQDKHSVAVVTQALDRELRRLGLGQVEPAAWLNDGCNEWPVDPTISNHPIGGFHHMGTTRMATDPKRGVVDGDCRVHGYANLWIAGSSVFPTGGWANPTLTILALALRLGAHLRGLPRDA